MIWKFRLLKILFLYLFQENKAVLFELHIRYKGRKSPMESYGLDVSSILSVYRKVRMLLFILLSKYRLLVIKISFLFIIIRNNISQKNYNKLVCLKSNFIDFRGFLIYENSDVGLSCDYFLRIIIYLIRNTVFNSKINKKIQSINK